MAQDTAHATQDTERAHRGTGAKFPGHRTRDTRHRAGAWGTGAKRPRTPRMQHNPPSGHNGEQEPSGPGRRTRNTTHQAGTPVNRSQGAQDTAHTTQHTERAHWGAGAKWPRTPHTREPNQTGAKAKGTEKTRQKQEDKGKLAAGANSRRERHTPRGWGGGAQLPAGAGHQEAEGGAEDNKRKGGLGWGGGAQQQAATNSSAWPGTTQTRATKGTPAAARRHPRNKKRGCRTARALEAGPSDPARTKGWRTTCAREAGPSVPARRTPETTNAQQRRPYGGGDNSTPTKQAEHPAGYNTTKRNPSTRTQHAPPRGGGANKHGTPQQGGGGTHKHSTSLDRQTPQTTNTHQRRPYGSGDNGEPTKQAGHPAGYNTKNRNPNARTHHAPPRGGPRTNTARPRLGGGHAPAQYQPRPSQQHNRNHNPPNRRRRPKPNTTTAAGGHQHSTGHAPTQHASPRGGPQTNAARPTRGGGTHQHSSNPGQANTTDNQHPTTPAVWPRRQQRTNKTSRASSQLQHHEPKHQGGGHAQTRHAPTGGGGHTLAQHQRWPGHQHNRNHNPPNR